MAQTTIPVTSGVGNNVEFQSTAGAKLRQTVVLGDPTTDANVATVTAAGAIKVDNSAVTQPSNVSQINGITPLMGNGVTGTGSQRVTIASDNTAFPVNANISQINSITPLMGNGVTGTGSQRVTIASDNTAFPVNANAGTNLNTSLLALESGGNLATIGGAIIAQEATTSGVKGIESFGAVTTAKPTYTTGKSDALSLDVNGLLRVSLADTPANGTKILVTPDSVALPANQSVNVSQINGITPLMGNGATGTGSQRVTIASDNTVLPSVGAGATGSAVPANASYDGLIAKTSLPTAATDANLVGAMSDKYGRQVIVTNGIRDIVSSQTTTISASTSETTIGTAVASTFLDLTAIMISNTSATAARVDFRDTTAGTVLFSIYVPAGDVRGITFSTPQPQTTVNTNWTAQSSASVTDLRIFLQFIKNK